MWTPTIMGKYCNTHIFLSFWVPSLNSAENPFRNFPAVLTPSTLYKVETRKKILDTRVQHCLWGEGRFWTGVNRKTPQKRKSVSRLLSIIVGTRIFLWTKIRPFLCERRLRLATSFWHISLPSLHDHNVKFPYATFNGGRKHTENNFSFSFF